MCLQEHVIQHNWLIGTAAIGKENVAICIEHLVVYNLVCKGFVWILHGLSFAHDYASLNPILQVQFEGLLLKFFDHCDVSALKVTNAELEYFQLSSQLLKERLLVLSEQRMHLGLKQLMLVGLENSFEECHYANTAVFFLSALCDFIDFLCELSAQKSVQGIETEV